MTAAERLHFAQRHIGGSTGMDAPTYRLMARDQGSGREYVMRYGFVEHALRVIIGLLDVAEYDGGRLPELFCGFDRTEFEARAADRAVHGFFRHLDRAELVARVHDRFVSGADGLAADGSGRARV